MAAYRLAVLALVLCLVQQCQGQPRITVTPTQLTLTSNTTSIGGTVTVKCEPPSTGVSTLLSLIIFRVLHSNPNAPRVEVVAAGSDQNNGNPTLGSSVTGTVDGSISQNFISLTMSQAKCRDGGMYICEASYTTTGSIVERVDVSRNLTVEVTPGAISLFATPSGVTTWTVNETLTLTCNGPVGTVEGNTQVTWNWQYRKTTDTCVEWNHYDGPYSDIQDGATTKPDPCYENRISVLTRHLTLDDTSRIYRCFITKDLMYTGFAAEFSVGTVTTATPATIFTTSPAMTSTTTDGASNSTQQESGQGQARITVTPTPLTLTPNTTSIGGTVTVKCEPPSTGVLTLLRLFIFRVLHSNPNAPRVEVVAAGDHNNGNPSLTPGSSVTGTVDGSISQNFISLTMSQAKCRDGGMYICEASYFKTGSGSIVETVDVSRNLIVEVTSGAISLFATPSGVTTWTVNETLTLTCNGPVGTAEGNSQVTWNWQYRKTTDTCVEWNHYDGPHSDIQDGVTTKPDPCYENRISVLTRRLTLDDTSRIYRCFITKDLVYTGFAAEFSVGTLTTATISTTSPAMSSTTTDGASNSTQHESGNKNGSRREVVTLPLLMTSLMATFVVTVLSTGGR